MKDRFAKFVTMLMITYPFVVSAQDQDTTDTEWKYSPVDPELYQTILEMDKAYFNAYNTCDMEKQASIYSEDLEFYHDQGGLTTSKQAVLEAIEKNICGKVTRTLVEDSVEVYPIPDYGAVEIGYHKFYNNQEPNAPSKPSRFIILWRKVDENWKISKVISLH